MASMYNIRNKDCSSYHNMNNTDLSSMENTRKVCIQMRNYNMDNQNYCRKDLSSKDRNSYHRIGSELTHMTDHNNQRHPGNRQNKPGHQGNHPHPGIHQPPECQVHIHPQLHQSTDMR